MTRVASDRTGAGYGTERVRGGPVAAVLGCVLLAAASLTSTGAEVLRVPFHVENTVPLAHPGWTVQGGIPFPRGRVPSSAGFTVRDAGGDVVPAQVNRTATWPDGSLKWVLVIATLPQSPATRRDYVLEAVEPGPTTPASRPLEVRNTADAIMIDTGVLALSVPRNGGLLLRSLVHKAGAPRDLLEGGGGLELFAALERVREDGSQRIDYRSSEHRVALEERGSERAVVRIEGVMVSERGESFGPYVVRLHAHAASGIVRVTHSFTYDADPESDFVRALGLRLRAKLDDLTGGSLGGERGTGYRMTWNAGRNLPLWSTAVLAQNDATSYSIRKWVDEVENSAVRVEAGTRSQGWGRLEAPTVHLALVLRHPWREAPKAVAIDGAKRALAAYIYSPYAERLDLRRYSRFTHSELYETSVGGPEPMLQEPEPDWRGHISPADLGARHIAKTSELLLSVTDGREARATARDALFFEEPPRLTATPGWIAATRVFGDYAVQQDADGAAPSGRVADAARFLVREQDYRGWYSFLDYGDLVHSYDPDRDVWCQDEGGYAWNNNEHCIAEGLWTAYLHSGDIGVFRLAAAMTRHVGDVDMYHGGPLAGNGTRHNVNHYGCSSKKRRMTLPENKRMHYFLTGDERTRDLIHFVLRSFAENELEHKVMASGRNTMDLAVYASALLFLWETTGEQRYGDLLRKTTEAMCAFRVQGRGFRQYLRFDLATGAVEPPIGPGLSQIKFRLNPASNPSNPNADAVPQTRSFLLKFGPMDLLLATAELTGSEVVHRAILDWAELLHLPESEVARFQGRFRAGLDCGRVAAYAYRHTRDERYREMLRRWLADPTVWFESVGEPGDPLSPPHVVPRNGPRDAGPVDRARERFQLRDIADLLRNGPYGMHAVELP